MAELSILDKVKLEKILQMEEGFVLDFTNRKFSDFVKDSVGIDIYDEKYNKNSGSKANRLRALWEIEPPDVVVKLLNDLYDYWKFISLEDGQYLDSSTGSAMCDYENIITRLQANGGVDEIQILDRFMRNHQFEELSNSISGYIRAGKPSLALDRLHTLVTRYLRQLLKTYGHENNAETPLHSLMGKYLKVCRANQKNLSEMTERIFKSSISTLEAFNGIRNNSSYAHDNNVLGTEESRFIVSNVISLLRFIDSIESQNDSKDFECDETYF